MNLREKRAALIKRMQELSAFDEMTAEQIKEFDQLEADVKVLDGQIKAQEERQAKASQLTADMNRRTSEPERNVPGAAAYNRGPRGDSEANAFRAFVRSGDRGGLRHLLQESDDGRGAQVVFTVPTQRETRMALGGAESRAVVDSNMNITTAADGGNMVPTGFSGQVALRKNELMLAERIGCRRIPGQGTTVNYPYESADPEVFPTVAEQVDAKSTIYEREGWPTSLKAFTLVKKARKVELTEELLEDNAVALMDYIADRIAREIAKTHNAMLIAEAGTNGTLLKTFASATAIAAGEPEVIVGNDPLGFYLDDGAKAGWIMRSSTNWAIRAITGNPRLYAGMENGLLGYPVFYSNSAGAMTTTQKSVYFGNWDLMGYREDPQVRFIQDPYSVDGLVVLKYSFRSVYGVLQGAALGWGAQL